jgi:LPS export ABC transporter permease LptG/LPS export ABC transporter permease LptF
MLKYFDRYVLRELGPPFGLGLLIYSFVLLANQLLQFPELFIARGVPFGASLRLLLYLVPAILAFTIPMAVIMGILAGLARLSTDSEVVAFKGLGVSHRRMLRPLIVFAFFGWASTSFLTLYLTPRFNYKWIQTVAVSVLDKVQLQVNPREFNESVPDMVLYLQDASREKGWSNVFISFAGGPLESRVVLARNGRLNYYSRSKRATIELFDAIQHSVAIDDPDTYDVAASSHMEEEVNIESLVGAYSGEKRAREKDILELARSLAANKVEAEGLAREKAGLEGRGAGRPERSRSEVSLLQNVRDRRTLLVEAHKRFALPFVCWIFVLLGLPLGLSTRKGGRTSGFTLSLVIILAYYILITAGEKMAIDGRIAPWLGMWGGNIVFAVLGLFLFVRSARERPLSLLLGRRRAARLAATAVPASSGRPSRRGPRPALPFPNILDRYVIRRYAFIAALILVSFLAISAVVTFFDRLGNLYQHNQPLGMLLDHIWNRMPEFLLFGIPTTALMATLLTLGLFTKFNEITAMKACGVSVYRAVVPVLVLAVLLGALSFHVQENVLPRAARKAEEIWNRINEVPTRSFSYQNRRWLASGARDRFYHFDYFDPKTQAFGRLWIFDIDPDRWTLRRRLFAEKAVLDGDSLLLSGGWEREFDGGVQTARRSFDRLEVPVPEGRSLFVKETKTPSEMSFVELGRYIGEVEALGFDTRRLRVDRSSKASFPLVALVMTLLGVPFAFAMGKRGTLVGVGVSLAVALVYWVAIGVFKSLGYVGVLTVFLAAWGPNLLFGLLGAYLHFRQRT